VDPAAGGDADENQSNDSFKTAIPGPVLEEPPHETQNEKVSSMCCLLVSCHKQLSFKLHVEGESNGLVESTLL